MTESSTNNFHVKIEFEDDRRNDMDMDSSNSQTQQCIGISTEPYVEYEKISTEIDDYKIPTWIRKNDEDNIYRHVKCTGVARGRTTMCDNCSKAKKTLDGLKQEASLHYCPGIPKQAWHEQVLDRPIADLEDCGDRFRHVNCTRKMNDVASDACAMCKELKRRLGNMKRNLAKPKTPVNRTNRKYSTLEQRKERKQATPKTSISIKRPRRSRSSIVTAEANSLCYPLNLHYVRMTMLLTYPHCEWGDCHSPPFSKAKDLTQHFHMAHEANMEPEVLEDVGIVAGNPNLTLGQEIYPCQWRGCSFVGKNLIALQIHLYGTEHLASSRLMHFEQNFYAGHYGMSCKWKECPNASAQFRSLKEIFDHLMQEHIELQPEAEGEENIEFECQWAGCEEETFPSAILLQQHVDSHFGGALRSVWQLENSLKEVNSLLAEDWEKGSARWDDEKDRDGAIAELLLMSGGGGGGDSANGGDGGTGAGVGVGVRRSSRPKKPSARFVDALEDRKYENGLAKSGDDHFERSMLLPERSPAKSASSPKKPADAASEIPITILVSATSKDAAAESVTPAVITEFDFDTYYLLWAHLDSVRGVGCAIRLPTPGVKSRVKESENATGNREPVTWERLRHDRPTRMQKMTKRPPSFSSYLKSSSLQMYKSRLMLAHSICFWGPCRERFQTIRQLADHVAASHLKPYFDGGMIGNIPCCWRGCKMVCKNRNALFTHLAENHIGNEDLMVFQETGLTPSVPVRSACLWADCGEIFNDYRQFHTHVREAHIKTFHGPRHGEEVGEKFQCQWADCKQTVTRQTHLQAHMQHLHIGDDWLIRLCEPPTEKEIKETKYWHFNRPIPDEVDDPDWFYDQFWMRKFRNDPGFPRKGRKPKPKYYGMGLTMKRNKESMARDAQILMNPQCFWAGCDHMEPFQKIKELAEHVEEVHMKPLKELEGLVLGFKFPCHWADCQKEWDSMRSLRAHMLRVHFGTPALMRLQDEGLNFAPNCYWGVCRAQFSCLEELMEHVEERHLDPLRNYEFPSGIQCKWLNCAKTVKDWRTLTYHVQSAHTGTEWAVAMLRLLQGNTTVESPLLAMNPILPKAKSKMHWKPKPEPEPLNDGFEEFLEMAMPKRQLRTRKMGGGPFESSSSKKMLKKIAEQRAPGKRIIKKRKISSSSSSSSSTGGGGDENLSRNSEEGRESLESGEIVFTPKKRIRRQAAAPKVEVERAIEFDGKYEAFDQPAAVYFDDEKERPDDEEEEETPEEDFEVQYVSVPVRVPKGARVSVPMGALGRVEVDQGAGFRRSMALVDDQQPSTSNFAQYPHVQQQQAKGPPGAAVRVVIARQGVGMTRLQEYSQQLQAHQQHQDMYYQNEEDVIGAYMEL